MFSFFVVLLDFRKYQSKVLYPKIVISDLTGFVLCLCQDFSCLITGHAFDCFVRCELRC